MGFMDLVKKAFLGATDEENQKANAYILVSQRAKAVWKNGINVNLAAKLTWYKISIIDVEDDSSEKKD